MKWKNVLINFASNLCIRKIIYNIKKAPFWGFFYVMLKVQCLRVSSPLSEGAE